MSKMVIATSASAEPPIPISGAYTPLKLTIFGLVAWCLLLFIGPLQIDTSNFDFEALLFLAISMGAMMGGMWVGNAFGARPSRVNYINPADMPKRLFLIITAVALLGLVLRITDRFGLRDMEITADLWQNRLSLEGDTTIFGLIGAALFPFGLALIPILWSMPREKQTGTKTIIAYLMLAYPALEAVLQASRSSVLQALFVWFIYSLFFGRNKLLTRRPEFILLMILAFLLFSQWFFALRTDEAYGTSFLVASQVSGYALYAPPSKWAIEMISGDEGIFATLVASWLHFTQYFCHSLFVYFDNFVNFTREYSYGGNNFYIIVKSIYSLLGLGEMPDYFGRAGGTIGLAGTYFSFLYYDFGWFGPLFAFAVGFIMSKVYRLAVARPWQWLPLYAFLSFAAMLLMVDNFLTGGLAVFAVVSLTGYAIFAGFVARMERRAAPGLVPIPIAQQLNPL